MPESPDSIWQAVISQLPPDERDRAWSAFHQLSLRPDDAFSMVLLILKAHSLYTRTALNQLEEASKAKQSADRDFRTVSFSISTLHDSIKQNVHEIHSIKRLVLTSLGLNLLLIIGFVFTFFLK